MKPWKGIFLLVIVVLTITSLLLSACGPVENQHGNSKDGKDKNKEHDLDQNQDKGSKMEKILICHRTGSAKHPYAQVRVANEAAKEGHGTHAGDLIPAPASGCPKTAAPVP